MTPMTTTRIREIARRFRHGVPRALLAAAGFIMMTAGLAMTATIVLLPGGIVIGLLGVATLVTAFFAPNLVD